jgi:hypothetical protein
MRGFKEVVTVPCDCGCEKIVIEIEDEPPIDEYAYISIWEQRHSEATLGMKIRHMLKILRDGDPYAGQMLLKADDCERLGKAFIKAAELLRENTEREKKRIRLLHEHDLDEHGFWKDEHGAKWKIEDYDEHSVVVTVVQPDGRIVHNIVRRKPTLTK